MIAYPENQQQNEFLKAWLKQRIPEYEPADAVCFGVFRDKRLLAVAAYNNWRRVDIEVSFAADDPRWASRRTIAGLLVYPFHQLKVQRVTALCLKSNQRARRFVEGIGFVREGKLRHAGPHKEALFLYGMTQDDYLARYSHGLQTTTQSAASA